MKFAIRHSLIWEVSIISNHLCILKGALRRAGQELRNWSHERDFALVVGVMLLAFALRLIQPTWVEFKRDEATIVWLSQTIARAGARPALGVPSSFGTHNLPFTLYLTALPLWLSADPLAAVVFTAVLNAAAVPLCYWLTRVFFGKRAALIAAFLFAVNPWAVLYARKVWARTMPAFTLLFFGALLAAIVKRRRWGWPLACVSLAALVGLQLEAIAFIPILALALLLNRDRIDWRALGMGVLLAVVLVSPYFIYDATHGWQNTLGLLRYGSGGEGRFSWDALRYAFMLSSSAGIEGQAGPFYAQFRQETPPFWAGNGILHGLLALALGYALFQAFRAPERARRRSFGLLLLWFFTPVALQLRLSSPTQFHYFVMLYPVQFMLIGILLQAGLERLEQVMGTRTARRAGWLLAALLLMWGGWQIGVTQRLRTYMREHPSTGGYGIPLHYTRETARAALHAAGDAEIIVMSEATGPLLAETSTVFTALLYGHPHRFVDGRNILLTPDAPRAVTIAAPLLEAEDPHSMEPVLQRLARSPAVTQLPSIVLPDGPVYRLYLREAAARADLLDGLTLLGDGVLFANRAVFAGFEAAEMTGAGELYPVWLAWWLLDAPPAGNAYHFTMQLLNAEGVSHAQHDHAAFAAGQWRAGDLVLSRFTLDLPPDLPPGAYTLWAGMYTYPDITPVAAISPDGVPYAVGVTLAQIVVVAPE